MGVFLIDKSGPLKDRIISTQLPPFPPLKHLFDLQTQFNLHIFKHSCLPLSCLSLHQEMYQPCHWAGGQ